MSNLDKELTFINCAHCGQKVAVMKEFIKPKIYCTIRCLDADNLNGNITKGIKA